MAESPRPKVSIEAGHFYAPLGRQQPELVLRNNTKTGFALANSINNSLKKQDITSKQILFVDDVEHAQNQARYLREAHAGIPIAIEAHSTMQHFIEAPINLIKQKENKEIQIYKENDFLEEAQKIIGALKTEAIKGSHTRLSIDGKSVIFGTGKNREKIRLIGYSERYPELPSCEVLDLCTYRKRLEESDETITLLPQDYEGQQNRVRKLFELLQEDPHVTIGYHDTEGNIVKVDQWHSQHSPTSDKIASIVAAATQSAA